MDDPLLHLRDKRWASREAAEQELLTACQALGFAANRRRCENYCKKLGYHQRHTYECYKGPGRETRRLGGAHRRNKGTVREGCTWACVLSYYKSDKAWRFFYLKNRMAHCHPMSAQPGAIASNRRRQIQAAVPDIEAAVQGLESTTTAIVDMVLAKYPGMDITRKDVVNQIQKARRKSLLANAPAVEQQLEHERDQDAAG